MFLLQLGSGSPQNLLFRVGELQMIAKGATAFGIGSVDCPGCALMWQVHTLLSIQFSSKMENAITVFSKILWLVQK